MRTATHVAEPYFVTPHAIQRARQRVAVFRRLGDQAIIETIRLGLQEAAPAYPPERTIAIAERSLHPRFVAIVEPPLPAQEWPSVVTVWGWGACPFLLRRKRCWPGPDKRYRYLKEGEGR